MNLNTVKSKNNRFNTPQYLDAFIINELVNVYETTVFLFTHLQFN